MTFEEAIIKKLQHDYKLLQLSCDGFKADRDRLAAELDRVTKGTWSKEIARLAAELAEAQRQLSKWESEVSKEMPPDFKDWWQNSKAEWPTVARLVLENRRKEVEFWRATAERRGNEIKRLYLLEALTR